MKLESAIKIMEENRQVYDLLAEDFSRTRPAVWEEFKTLEEYFQDGDKVLDLGCGNGRFLELFQNKGKKIQYIGVDNSPKLLEIAQKRYPQARFVLTDGLKLPFEDNFFDKILCIAVLHHLPGYELRRQFLRQAYRVLKPGGAMILTVWCFNPKYSKQLKNLLRTVRLKVTGKAVFDWGDVYVPWGDKKKIWRYIHNFSKSELRNLFIKEKFSVEKIEFLICKSGEKNLLAIAKK